MRRTEPLYQIQYLEHDQWLSYGDRESKISDLKPAWLRVMNQWAYHTDCLAIRIVKLQQGFDESWLIREVVEYKQIKKEV